MNKAIVCGIILSALIVFNIACEKKEPAPEAKQESQPAEVATETATPAAETKTYSGPAAVVNGVEISEQQVIEERDNIIAQRGGQIPPDQLEQFKPQILSMAVDNMVKRTLLDQAADAADIQVDPAEVDKTLAELKANQPESGQFETILAQMGITEEEFKKDLAQDLRLKALLEKEQGGPDITDEEVVKFYDDNPSFFKQEAQVQASHILINIEETDSEQAKADKLKKIEGLKTQLLEGASFSELALANSDCPSKNRGGDLGSFGTGRMVPEFEQVAFSIEPGKISDVVKTKFGYHIIKVTNKTPEQVTPLEEAKDKIKSHLEQQGIQGFFQTYIAGLMAKAEITYREDMKPKLPQMPPTPPTPPTP